MARKSTIGDVYEIRTPLGFAYFQFTHKKPTYGSPIRVLPNVFEERPTDFDTIVRGDERFVIFFPVGAALSRGIITLVGNFEIPLSARRFPLFKDGGGRDPATKQLRSWWLWDGDREWRVPELTPEQKRLPVPWVVNDTMLINQIVSGWSPEDEAKEPS
jgi:hypothetical protein